MNTGRPDFAPRIGEISRIFVSRFQFALFPLPYPNQFLFRLSFRRDFRLWLSRFFFHQTLRPKIPDHSSTRSRKTHARNRTNRYQAIFWNLRRRYGARDWTRTSTLCGRYHLKVVRLPISPPAQTKKSIARIFWVLPGAGHAPLLGFCWISGVSGENRRSGADRHQNGTGQV
jgi:hypothetical protein